MAEVQTATESGEMAQRFIELVMMQAQNAAYALGQIPHPETGDAPVNLDLARLFIDQLIVLRVKTRGNLSPDEAGVLNNAISNLQMAFIEVSKTGAAGGSPGNGQSEPSPVEAAPEPQAALKPEATSSPIAEPGAGEEETRKKFTKSYGS